MVEALKSPSLLSDDVDYIKKPRTMYSSNALRRVQPNLNIQDKKNSLSVMKLKVFTAMRLQNRDEDGGGFPRKIMTVQHLPKMMSIMGNARAGRDDFMAKKHGGPAGMIDPIQEEEASKRDESSDGKSDDDTPSEEDEGSSIDGDGEDEERMYQQIIAAQNKGDGGQSSVEDLIDKEMVDLLRVCAQFKQPPLDEIMEKCVNFGPSDRSKVLILDMDETLIHARFLMTPAQEKNDDGDFTVSIASTSGAEQVKISVKMRPFLDNCLEHLAKYYEIAVFTAGEQSYADAVLDYLDEER